MATTLIFDVDGVLVDSPHERAWGDTLRSLLEGGWSDLAGSGVWTPEAYTSALYQAEVAGKPRMDGARSLLRAFGLPDDDEHARRLAARKQGMIERLIDRGEFRAYEDAVGILLRAKASGMTVAAASSSKNANAMMGRVKLAPFQAAAGVRLETLSPDATLLDALDANVSGRDIHPGKPHPMIFLTAAEEAGSAPADCIVVEDAPSGVQAAKAGGMRAIGLARHNDEDSLRAAGADWVVNSLDGIDPGDLR
jgi:beta-phosphoglucomutase-like phosphatase (HAD superfamily)